MWIRHATLYNVGLLEITPKVSYCYLVIFSMNFKMCNDNVSVTWYEIVLHFLWTWFSTLHYLEFKMFCPKELSFCHKHSFSNYYIFVFFWWKYFKFRLLDSTLFIVWNINGVRRWVAKLKGLENQSLWQRLNSFLV